MSYTLNTQYVLGANEGSSQRTTGKMIVFHSTANIGASAANNAAFEKRTWNSNGAYVHFIAGDGVVYQVGEPGYVAWGAGQTANAIAPVQIEMEESADNAKQLRIYNTVIALIRDMAAKYGVALTFEANSYTGVQTHRHIAKMNGETDHSDPWAPLARIGKSQAQVAADIKNGAGKVVATTPASNPVQTNAKPASTKGVVVTNVTYDLHQKGAGWLGEVTNFNNANSQGFAGNPNHQHDALVVKVSHGSVKYRVHTSQDGWLPYVTGYDRGNATSGFAGTMGHVIDGVQVYYTTPSGETFQQAYYRSQTTKRAGWLPFVRDDTDFAGMLGEPLDRLQIKIAPSNPF